MGIEIPDPVRSPPPPREYSRLNVDPATAEVIRRIAKADRLSLDEVLDRMARAYVRLHHPDWRMVEDDAPDVTADDLETDGGMFGGATRPRRR